MIWTDKLKMRKSLKRKLFVTAFIIGKTLGCLGSFASIATLATHEDFLTRIGSFFAVLAISWIPMGLITWLEWLLREDDESNKT